MSEKRSEARSVARGNLLPYAAKGIAMRLIQSKRKKTVVVIDHKSRTGNGAAIPDVLMVVN
jgi:hypothetical protein